MCPRWNGRRAQFFCDCGADDAAHPGGRGRARGSQKRGGYAIKVGLDTIAVLSPAPDRSILALDDALTTFSELAPRRAKMVELRYFGGLTEDEIFVALGSSERTLRRDWDFAEAWLLRELSHTVGDDRNPGHDSGALPAD